MKLLCALAAAAALGVSSQAGATIYLGLQAAGVNNGAVTQVGSDGGTGSIGYTGFTFGNFVSNISAQGSPVLPQPMLQTTSINTQSTSAGVLTIYITQTNLGAPISGLASSFTANAILNFGSGTASVSEYTYFDAGNGIFSGTQLASATFTSIGSQSMNTPLPTPTGPYSETTKYVVTIGAGGGSVNNTINFAAGPGAVPEPASWAMMIAGFGLVGGALRRRSTVRTATAFA